MDSRTPRGLGRVGEPLRPSSCPMDTAEARGGCARARGARRGTRLRTTGLAQSSRRRQPSGA
eukprot:12072464-Prorocentrum_lima.AAC.1